MFRGEVLLGDQRGRLLGFPTANLAVVRSDVALGVYAGYAVVSSFRHGAAVSIGRRETFYAGSGALLLEAHLLDFDGDLYGQMIDVHLLEKLRDQRAFDSLGAIVEQINLDIDRVRATLSGGQASVQHPGIMT